MDPNTARSIMIELANQVISQHNQNTGVDTDTALALAEAVHGLDVWLRMGGFIPQAWVQGRENDARITE